MTMPESAAVVRRFDEPDERLLGADRYAAT